MFEIILVAIVAILAFAVTIDAVIKRYEDKLAKAHADFDAALVKAQTGNLDEKFWRLGQPARKSLTSLKSSMH